LNPGSDSDFFLKVSVHDEHSEQLSSYLVRDALVNSSSKSIVPLLSFSLHEYFTFDIIEMKKGALLSDEIHANQHYHQINKIWRVFNGIINCLIDLQKLGLMAPTLTPNDFIITEKNEVVIFNFDKIQPNHNPFISENLSMLTDPNLLDDISHLFNGSSEVYAFGIVLLEMIDLKYAQEMRNYPGGLRSFKKNGKFKIKRGSPKIIADTIRRCLNSDRNQRPSLEELQTLSAIEMVKTKYELTTEEIIINVNEKKLQEESNFDLKESLADLKKLKKKPHKNFLSNEAPNLTEDKSAGVSIKIQPSETQSFLGIHFSNSIVITGQPGKIIV